MSAVRQMARSRQDTGGYEYAHPRSLAQPPFGYAQDRPFGYAPFDYAQGRPFGYAPFDCAQGRPFGWGPFGYAQGRQDRQAGRRARMGHPGGRCAARPKSCPDESCPDEAVPHEAAPERDPDIYERRIPFQRGASARLTTWGLYCKIIQDFS